LYFVLGVHPSEISKDAPLTADQFVKSFHDALVYSMFRTLLGRAWKFLPQAKYIQACATAHNFVDFYVEKAVQEQEQEDMPLSKRSLIRSLSSQTNDKEYIRSQVIQAMMAAQDTTSELLTNAFFLLARNAEYWTRLRAEITEAGDGIFEVDRLTSSKLISNILFESRFLLWRLTLCELTV
jgi:cytochrome P450